MKIAHFSDVHALALGGVPAWQWLSKRAAGYLNLRLNRREKHPVALFEALIDDLNRLSRSEARGEAPDQVIVTGDLTNLSLAPELALARSIIDRLSLGPGNVTVIPGNHDVYTLDALLGKGFQKTFADYFRSDDGSDGFPVVRVRGEVAILGLSTALPSPPPLADGWVGRAQLAALEQALSAHADKFRIVALHHPPVKNRVSILRGLRDRGALQRVIARAGCELILHGHEHRDLRVTVAGPHGAIPVIGVGSGSYSDPRAERRARYNIYTIENGTLRAVKTRVYDPERAQFS